MQLVWRWGGEFFGYREGDALFAHHGLQVGQFSGDEVYASDGRYLGEIKSDNRLITNIGKKSRMRGSFMPVRRMGMVPYVNYVGYVMYVGYEDFPSVDEF